MIPSLLQLAPWLFLFISHKFLLTYLLFFTLLDSLIDEILTIISALCTFLQDRPKTSKWSFLWLSSNIQSIMARMDEYITIDAIFEGQEMYIKCVDHNANSSVRDKSIATKKITISCWQVFARNTKRFISLLSQDLGLASENQSFRHHTPLNSTVVLWYIYNVSIIFFIVPCCYIIILGCFKNIL